MAKDDRDEVVDISGQQGNRARVRRTSDHAQQRQAEGRPVGPGFSDAQQVQLIDVFLQPNRRLLFVAHGDVKMFLRQMERISRVLTAAGVRINV